MHKLLGLKLDCSKESLVVTLTLNLVLKEASLHISSSD